MNSGYSMTVAISLISAQSISSSHYGALPWFRLFGARGSEQQVENQKRDPDVNGGIGDIEDEKVPSKRVQIEIIDDGAMRKPINGIA